jgi:hypothetical protein
MCLSIHLFWFFIFYLFIFNPFFFSTLCGQHIVLFPHSKPAALHPSIFLEQTAGHLPWLNVAGIFSSLSKSHAPRRGQRRHLSCHHTMRDLTIGHDSTSWFSPTWLHPRHDTRAMNNDLPQRIAIISLPCRRGNHVQKPTCWGRVIA